MSSWNLISGLLDAAGSSSLRPPHLVAVHLVAVFEAEGFAQRDVDGEAHDGHGEGFAYQTGEQRSVWSLRSLHPGVGATDERLRLVQVGL